MRVRVEKLLEDWLTTVSCCRPFCPKRCHRTRMVVIASLVPRSAWCGSIMRRCCCAVDFSDFFMTQFAYINGSRVKSESLSDGCDAIAVSSGDTRCDVIFIQTFDYHLHSQAFMTVYTRILARFALVPFLSLKSIVLPLDFVLSTPFTPTNPTAILSTSICPARAAAAAAAAAGVNSRRHKANTER